MVALLNFARLFREDIGQHKLVSGVDVEAGEVLSPFRAASILARPTYLTVQVSEDRHIVLEPGILEFINHGCEPNVFFDTERMELVSLRPIRKGDELTFFYPSTEWDMAESFRCSCGSGRCLGEVRGARHLPAEALAGHRLTAHILRLLEASRGLEMPVMEARSQASRPALDVGEPASKT